MSNIDEYFLNYRNTILSNLREARVNDAQRDLALSAYDSAVRKAIEYKCMLDLLVEEINFDVGRVRANAIVSHSLNRYGEVKKTIGDYNKAIKEDICKRV